MSRKETSICTKLLINSVLLKQWDHGWFFYSILSFLILFPNERVPSVKNVKVSPT